MSNWQTLMAAVEHNDRTMVAHMRHDFPDERLGFALLLAVKCNSMDVVRELLNNPSDDILVYAPDALDKAAQDGHVDIVKLLLPHADPKAHDSNALLWAVHRNQQACVDVLFDVSDVDVVWRIANERRAHMNYNGFDYFEQRMVARAQQEKLTQEVGECGGVRARPKI